VLRGGAEPIIERMGASDPSELRAAERARYLATLRRIPPRPGILDRMVRVVVRAGFTLLGWRVRADGIGPLPRDVDGRISPCVLAAAPHRGWPDPFLVLLAWPADAPRLAWFGDEVTMTRSWWRRRLLPRLGMIPIDAGSSPGAVATYLDAARRVLERGCVIVVFAEKGPPSPRGRTRTIAPGAAWLAIAGDVPLVPVALAGFLESGLGTRFAVRFLRPIEPRGGERGEPGGRTGRAQLARDGRAMSTDLAAALAGPVARMEAASLGMNGRRPLAGLRRLFK
jgi:1-acyl-sn-glycerol-3-phosphate acyltransferase